MAFRKTILLLTVRFKFEFRNLSFLKLQYSDFFFSVNLLLCYSVLTNELKMLVDNRTEFLKLTF